MFVCLFSLLVALSVCLCVCLRGLWVALWVGCLWVVVVLVWFLVSLTCCFSLLLLFVVFGD